MVLVVAVLVVALLVALAVVVLVVAGLVVGLRASRLLINLGGSALDLVRGLVLVAGDDVELPANAPATPAPASSAKVAMVMISFLGFILGVLSFRELACLLAIPFRQKAREILDPIEDGRRLGLER